ncbi:MAG: siderophore-iron reductase FhuF [Brevibacillus sp.]|nr:siderophore-iron reductase FhuF [Brevibacillus sp.]
MLTQMAKDQTLCRTFRVALSDGETAAGGGAYPLTADQLLIPGAREEALEQFASRIESPSREVTASLLVKWYSLAMAALYAMSRYQYQMDLSPANVRLRLDDWPHFSVSASDAHVCRPEKRGEWRATVVKHLFAEHLHPLFQSLAEYSALPTQAFWAHTAYILHYWYPLWIKEAESETAQKLLKEDYRFLTVEAPADLFGPYAKNPLSVRFRQVEHPKEPGNHVRIRKQCCFIYKLPSVDRCCNTCPRLTEEERRVRLLEL